MPTKFDPYARIGGTFRVLHRSSVSGDASEDAASANLFECLCGLPLDGHGCDGWTHCGQGCCGPCPHCGR